MDRPVRVLIVDDHAIVREGLRTLLDEESDIAVVGEAADGPEALSVALKTAPDVVLMDLVLPGFDGIEATRQLRQRCPASRVVVLTSGFGEDLRVQEALQVGAIGYLLKDVLKPDLLQAIRQAAQGRPTLHPAAQEQLVRRASSSRAPHEDLTARELDVLCLIVQGRSNKKIAAALGLSEGTVKGYVSIVLSKLGVSDRTQAALYAVRNGLFGEKRRGPP